MQGVACGKAGLKGGLWVEGSRHPRWVDDGVRIRRRLRCERADLGAKRSRAAETKRYPQAIASMKHFLVLEPGALDARTIQDMIYDGNR